MVVSANSRTVYVSTQFMNDGTSGTGVEFTRDPANGNLYWTACFTSYRLQFGCTPVPGLGAPDAMALSPDGSSLYVAQCSPGSVTFFRRDPTAGTLAWDSCFRDPQAYRFGLSPDLAACGIAPNLLFPSAVTVSPDQGSVYVAADGG